MNLADGGPLLGLGVVLLAGILAGSVARRLRLPTLTGYIVAGIALGSEGAGLLPAEMVAAAERPVSDFAIGVVLFLLGGRIQLGSDWRSARPLLVLSFTDTMVTLACVAGAAMLVLPRADAALLLAVLAIEIAPATTVAVLGEYGARGRTTNAIRALTALSNLWVVLLFEAALLALALAQGDAADPAGLGVDLLGSAGVGLIAGHAFVYAQERTRWAPTTAPLLALVMGAIGACKLLGVPHMLAFLVAGAVVAHRSRLFEPIERGIAAFTEPALIAFFVMAGMHFDFGLLRSEWLAVSLYVLVRTAARILGTRIGLKLGGFKLGAATGGGSPPLGLGLLCQAGAAIALARYAADYDAELSEKLLNIVLGAVLIFELVGPVLLKHVVVAAGEVSLAQLSTHVGRAASLSPLRALGRTLRGRRLRRDATPAAVPVERIMRRENASLNAAAGLDEVLRFANQSRLDVFPVTDAQGRLTGTIRMADLGQVAYDRSAARLVTAQDIATMAPEESSLAATASLEEAERFFQRYEEHSAPVVAAADDLRLVGMLERAEILHLLRALRSREPAR